MIIERSSGTSLDPFLDEFHRTPRTISIVNILEDLLATGFLSMSDLIFASKQDIVISKSSLLTHFDQISFLRKLDADRLAQSALVMREDELMNLLLERATTMKNLYQRSIFIDDERKAFVERYLIQSDHRLPSLAIHSETDSMKNSVELIHCGF